MLSARFGVFLSFQTSFNCWEFMITIKITIKLFEWQSGMHHRSAYNLNSFFSSSFLHSLLFASRSSYSTTFISTTIVKLHFLTHTHTQCVHWFFCIYHIEYGTNAVFAMQLQLHQLYFTQSKHWIFLFSSCSLLTIFKYFSYKLYLWETVSKVSVCVSYIAHYTNNRFHIFFWTLSQYGIWLSSCFCTRNSTLFVRILRIE